MRSLVSLRQQYPTLPTPTNIQKLAIDCGFETTELFKMAYIVRIPVNRSTGFRCYRTCSTDWCLRNSFKGCLYTCLTPAYPKHGIVYPSPPLPFLPFPPLFSLSDRVSCLDYPPTYYAMESNLRTPDPPTSASQELRLHEWAIVPSSVLPFEGSRQRSEARIWTS